MTRHPLTGGWVDSERDTPNLDLLELTLAGEIYRVKWSTKDIERRR